MNKRETTRNTGTKRNNSNSRKSQNKSKKLKSDSASIEKVKSPKDDYFKTDGTNDPSWYANNPTMLKDAGSLSFANVLGLPVSLDGTDASSVISFASSVSHPSGIFKLAFAPSLGISEDSSSALNTAARNLYSNVRFANSGRTNYESQDLMIYVMAASQAYAYLGYLCRIYGLANVYSSRNRYFPKALIESMQVDFDSLIANLSDFRYYINQLIAKASVLWIPNTMPLTIRWFWMNSNIYTDSDDQKSQVYYYHQWYYWKYNPTLTEQGGGLETVLVPGQTDDSPATYMDLINFGNELLDVLVADEDIGIMSGDLLKAFGAGRLFSMNQIPDSYIVVPQYNREVLLQISNSTSSFPNVATVVDSSWNVKQNTGGVLEFAPYWSLNSGLAKFVGARKFLNFQDQDTSPENVMVATRLMMGQEAIYDPELSEIKVATCGSEIVIQYVIYNLVNGELQRIQFDSYMTEEEMSTALYTQLSQFDYHPAVYVCDATHSKMTGCILDLANYTTLGTYELNKLHETAILSELGVPYIVGN